MIKYFFVVPSIYLTVVIILLFNYFSEANKTSFQWGDVSLTINLADDEAKEQLKRSGLFEGNIAVQSVKVTTPQLVFRFSSKQNIVEEDDNSGLAYISELPSKEGFVLAFENDTYISFQTKLLNPREISILVQTQEDKEVAFSSRALFGYKIEEVQSILNLLSVNNKAKLLTSTNAEAMKNGRRLMLSTNASYASFHITENQFDDFPYISGIPRLPPTSIIETEKSIENYLNKSYQGWKKDRLDEGLGTWKQAEGFYTFSEDVLLSMYRETISRDELSSNKLFLEKIMHRNTSALSWKSALYNKENSDLFLEFFDFVQKAQRYALDEANKDNRKSIQDFDTWDSLPFWNNSTNIQSFLNFIKKREAINMLPENAIMILYQSTGINHEGFQKYIDENRHLLEQNIIHNTIVANDGYLVLDSKKNVNIKFSILAGKYLSQHASEYKMRLLGHRILFTALALSDQNGILPRMYVYTNTELASLGYIAPEEIYGILTDSDHPIREIEVNGNLLYSFSLSKVNVATQDNIMNIDINTGNKGITEYTYIWPLDAPRDIYGFDARWTGALFPENFTNGIRHVRNKKLLIIKMLSLSDLERVTLLF